MDDWLGERKVRVSVAFGLLDTYCVAGGSMVRAFARKGKYGRIHTTRSCGAWKGRRRRIAGTSNA